MVWGLALGAASSIAGGLLGGADAREAQRLNQQNFENGLNDFSGAFGAINDAETGALQDIDFANEILASVEPAVLAGMDEQLRIRVAQQVRQNQEQMAMQQQRAAAAGLDASTVGAGLQRSQAFGQAQQLGALSAGFAGQRAGALASARGSLAQGFMNRAGTVANFGAQRANVFGQRANYRAGFQFEAPNTGAAIGQIGGMIGNAITGYQQQQTANTQNSAFIEALRAMGFGGQGSGAGVNIYGPPEA